MSRELIQPPHLSNAHSPDELEALTRWWDAYRSGTAPNAIHAGRDYEKAWRKTRKGLAARFVPLDGDNLEQARQAWGFLGGSQIREDFATFEDYLAYRAAKKAAAAEQRALLRALETNPFTLGQALAAAQAFGVAIDALPVGKDIRGRLKGHLDAHVAALSALAEPARSEGAR